MLPSKDKIGTFSEDFQESLMDQYESISDLLDLKEKSQHNNELYRTSVNEAIDFLSRFKNTIDPDNLNVHEFIDILINVARSLLES